MSSKNRAERRRQARAAAKAGGLAPVVQRGEFDCMRAAVATVLGIPYEATPPIDSGGRGAHVGSEAFSAAWREWAATRGLTLRVFCSHCPTFLDAWIAVVDGYGRPDMRHSVVMRGARFAHDPSPHAHARRRTVTAADVRQAIVFAPAEKVEQIRQRMAELAAAGSPALWPITNPDDTPHGVRVLCMQGRLLEARAMAQRIQTREAA